MADESIPPLQFVSDEQAVARYAEISGDHSGIHLDAELARAQGLPGVILHGMHVFGQVVSHIDRCAADGTALRSVRCRFSDVSLPDEPVSVDFTSQELGTWTFQGDQNGRAVVTDGRATISRTDAGRHHQQR